MTRSVISASEQIENGMDGSDHKVELRQNFVLKIERAIAQDVAFDSGEDAEAIELLLSSPIAATCSCNRIEIEPVRLNRAAAVIGDAEILQPELLRRVRHLLERVVAVAGNGVTMKRAPRRF